MKVLHLIDKLGTGGAQGIVRRLVLENSNHSAYVLRDNNEKIIHDRILINSTKSKLAFPLFDIIRVVKSENCSIIHCHLFKSMISGVLLKVVFKRKILLVLHCHGMILDDNRIYKLFISIAQRYADLYVAVSETVFEKLIEIKIPKKKIIILPNFHDLKKVYKKYGGENRNKKNYGLGSSFVIGYVGRLVKVKSVDTLIKSLEYLNEDQFSLVIVGDGPEKNYLSKIAQKYEHKVIFAGKITKEKLQEYYELFDLFVMPSRRESFGMSVVEAQAMGVPVLVSRLEAFNEIIEEGENGLFFTPGDSKELAHMITLYQSNSQMRTRVIRAGRSSASKYSFDRFNNSLNLIYNNLESK